MVFDDRPSHRVSGRCGTTAEQEMLSTLHVPWQLEQPEEGERTPTWMHAWRLGDGRIVESSRTPVAGRRGPQEIARTPDQWIIASIQLRGRMTMSDAGGSVESGPGSIAIWDSTQPCDFVITEAEHKRNIFFPRDLLTAMQPSLDLSPSVHLIADAPANQLFRRVAGQVSDFADDLDDGARRASLRMLAELLLECVRPHQAAGRRLLQAGLYERANHHIERCLEDPGLRPSSLAEALRVPLRTLQDAFAHRGETIRDRIRMLRLSRCYADLQRADDRSITEIAFAHGFSNAAHFSRCFHARYGKSPREVRTASS